MKSEIQTFTQLIFRDLLLLKQTYRTRVINAGIWVIIVSIVYQHIMPAIGLSGSYGSFIAASMFASWGFFETGEMVGLVVADLEGPKKITYELTLPLSHWAVFARIGVSYTIQAMTVAFWLLPMAKIVLWNYLSLQHCVWHRLAIIFVLTNAFYGFFALFMIACTNSMRDMSSLYMRIIFPLWYLGCFQFSWKVLHDVSLKISYCALANPLTYIMEGTRAAIMGQIGSLPFWWCACMTALFTCLVGYVGIYFLKRRLDSI